MKFNFKAYDAIAVHGFLSLLPLLVDMPEQARMEILQGVAESPEIIEFTDALKGQLDAYTQQDLQDAFDASCRKK